ncbi:actin depolymerizing protein [Piedraia hortae CBS 480.64]|uniref:Actin depolymerizing protein n=1 Tax=Piedraia hortae CBS 480.64 TaxID=1314780 RepID=A0A6A7C4D2_9PEZI|nr:actin depolymerizing protein [Piedraia hortae CBS 480.64]
MQSGISASSELQDAFRDLLSGQQQRALLATISHEAIVPLQSIEASSASFPDELARVQSHLKESEAAYVLIRLEDEKCAAITYVPSTAPVRQRTLFASTRLTLARELGLEHFSIQFTATEPADLTNYAWGGASEEAEAPLTQAETEMKGLKEAEAREAVGTGARRGHVTGSVDVRTGEGVVEALAALKQTPGALLGLQFSLPDEILVLASPMQQVPDPVAVPSHLSTSQPQYAFYADPSSTGVIYMYTCPTASPVKQRMVYSAGKAWVRALAEREAGLTIARSLEATEPEELEIVESRVEADAGASRSFARPKRPGRR